MIRKGCLFSALSVIEWMKASKYARHEGNSICDDLQICVDTNDHDIAVLVQYGGYVVKFCRVNQDPPKFLRSFGTKFYGADESCLVMETALFRSIF